MARAFTNIPVDALSNSCRYCTTGQGNNMVADGDEVFYLCDKHKASYDIDKDKISRTLDELRKGKETNDEVNARLGK